MDTTHEPRPQRKICTCQASEHGLINNCMGCGKVICSIEGEGPCSFCGNYVCLPQNMNEYEEQMALHRKLEEDPDLLTSYIKAVENKDKLIRYDKTDIARKNMIDEDADWYEIKNDVWQSNEVREHAMQKMIDLEEEEERVKEEDVYYLDGKGGMVKVDQKVDYKKHRKEAQDYVIGKEKEESEIAEEMEADERLKKKQLEILNNIKSIYAANDKTKDSKKIKRTWNDVVGNKVQHDDCYEQFQKALDKQQELDVVKNELGDEYFDKALYKDGSSLACLSMWQPWASLVVYGIKRFEGRQWETDYRGPLWIHAGSRKPDPEEIKQVEDKYRSLYEGHDMPDFPTEYPTGCLLGTIDLQSVIQQEEYKAHIPKKYTKESTSEFLFVCRNPKKLDVTIRMPGKRGIFDLHSDVERSAKQGIIRVPSSWFPYYADSLPTPKIPSIKAEEEEEKEQVFKLVSKTQNSVTDEIINKKLAHEFASILEANYGKQIGEGAKGLNLKYDSNIHGFHLFHPILDAWSREYLHKGLGGLNIFVCTLSSFVQPFEFSEKFICAIVFGQSLEVETNGTRVVLNDAQIIGSGVSGFSLNFLRVKKRKKKNKDIYALRVGGGSLLVALIRKD